MGSRSTSPFLHPLHPPPPPPLLVFPPKNTPLMTAFDGPVFVTVIFTLPDIFHARYTPLPKFVSERVSSCIPVFASVIVIVSDLPSGSQSSAYIANSCVPVMVRFKVNDPALYHVDAIAAAPGTASARGSPVAGFHV